MDQLKQGATRLKHVEYSKNSVEFTLTPYEMLMVDIKTSNFKLNHVEMRSRTCSDARDTILKYIRYNPLIIKYCQLFN